MQAYLKIAVQEGERRAVLYLEGELDFASSSQLVEAIGRLGDRPRTVVVDLQGLTFIDMAGLRVLIAARDAAQQGARRLFLARVPDPIRRVITLAHVDALLPVLDGEG